MIPCLLLFSRTLRFYPVLKSITLTLAPIVHFSIQDAPPTLDREGGTYKYSRAFKEMVESCLVKDPSQRLRSRPLFPIFNLCLLMVTDFQRPTAEQLLQTPFFKSSKKKSYLVGAILSTYSYIPTTAPSLDIRLNGIVMPTEDLPPLTHRQERRVAHNSHALTHHSIDSWDFATTLNSPTTSVHRRRMLEEMDLATPEWDGEWEAEEMGGMFEMEGEREEGKRHSNAVSWGAEDVGPREVEVEQEQGLRGGREAETETETETETEVEIEGIPSSSSSPSDAEFPGASLAPSPASGSSPATSVAEIGSEPPPITPKPTDTRALAVPQAPPQVPVSSLPPLASSAPAPSTGGKSAAAGATATVRRVSSQGLWRKIKGAGGGKEKEKEKEKEKGGMGALFSRKASGSMNTLARKASGSMNTLARKASGNMNTLARTTSRTAQVVGECTWYI